MVTKRSDREKFKKLSTNLAYRSAADPHASLKKMQRKAKIRRQALARIEPTHTGPVVPGQKWLFFAHPDYGCHWTVQKVSSQDTVELRGCVDKLGKNWTSVTWYLGVEELTKLGTLLTDTPRGVIPDTIGSRGEDTAEA
jgi:hypothetical protein